MTKAISVCKKLVDCCFDMFCHNYQYSCQVMEVMQFMQNNQIIQCDTDKSTYSYYNNNVGHKDPPLR